MALMGSNKRYKRKILTSLASTPKATKNTLLIMFETRSGTMVRVTEWRQLLELYFQNPQFGYYFLVLTSQRLLQNIARLEAIIAQNKLAQQAAAAGGPNCAS